MKNKKFKLGPLQKKWINMLKSGKYEQAQGLLCKRDHRRHYSYCCLGVGVLCVRGEDYFHQQQKSGVHFSDVHNGNGLLSPGTVKELGLRTRYGSPKNFQYGMSNLTNYNDNRGWTHKQIGEHLEKYADYYFKESR